MAAAELVRLLFCLPAGQLPLTPRRRLLMRRRGPVRPHTPRFDCFETSDIPHSISRDCPTKQSSGYGGNSGGYGGGSGGGRCVFFWTSMR